MRTERGSDVVAWYTEDIASPPDRKPLADCQVLYSQWILIMAK